MESFHGFCKPHPDDVLEPSESEHEAEESEEKIPKEPESVEDEEDAEQTFLPDSDAPEKLRTNFALVHLTIISFLQAISLFIKNL